MKIIEPGIAVKKPDGGWLIMYWYMDAEGKDVPFCNTEGTMVFGYKVEYLCHYAWKHNPINQLRYWLKTRDWL